MIKEMPRTSKLTVVQLEEMKILLLTIPRPTQKSIAMRFHVASASVFYYQRKFNISPTSPKAIVEQPKKLKCYLDYLREDCERRHIPFTPPDRPESDWMPSGRVIFPRY